MGAGYGRHLGSLRSEPSPSFHYIRPRCAETPPTSSTTTTVRTPPSVAPPATPFVLQSPPLVVSVGSFYSAFHTPVSPFIHLQEAISLLTRMETP